MHIALTNIELSGDASWQLHVYEYLYVIIPPSPKCVPRSFISVGTVSFSKKVGFASVCVFYLFAKSRETNKKSFAVSFYMPKCDKKKLYGKRCFKNA